MRIPKIKTFFLLFFFSSGYLFASSVTDSGIVHKKSLVTGGIQRLLVSVSDMEISLSFYRDIAGFQLIAEAQIPKEITAALWGLPERVSARSIILQKDSQPTLLELIEFQSQSGKAIRENAGLKDFGLYDITFMVEDTVKQYQELKKKGFVFAAHNIQYPPGLFPFDVKESILIGPDGVPITHMQMLGSEKTSIPGIYSSIKASTQVVESMKDAIRFYRDILGMELRSEVSLPKGLLDEPFSLPKGTEAKMAFLNRVGSEYAMLAILELTAKGSFLSERLVPPNTGLFMIAFETENMSVLINRLKEHSIKFLAGPVVRDLDPYGKISAVHIEGPSGIKIELFERLR